MKTNAALLILGVSGMLAAPLAADSHKKGGWKSLFDGKSLAGWKSSTDNPAAFSVTPEGTLKVTGKRAHLFYVGADGKASFENFELKLKAMTTPNSNSGVYFHTEYQAEGWPAKGYECQVNSTQKDPKKTGSLYGVVNVWADPEQEQPPFVTTDNRGGINLRVKKAPSTDNEWFDYHITVEGKKITLKVNGMTTVEFIEPDGWKGPHKGMSGRFLSKGTIAFQAHDPGSTVFYKDIRLKVND
ncbi:MAG: DUF1080 domain-containing protein [Akkermansiaceae bacterium]|nr:DUF1080 domain-containing protein [Akkermansiaceae bacterium]